MGVILNKSLDGSQSLRLQAKIVRQFDAGLQPELGLAIRTMYMDMHTELFAREEVKPISSIAQDRRAHGS